MKFTMILLFWHIFSFFVGERLCQQNYNIRCSVRAIVFLFGNLSMRKHETIQVRRRKHESMKAKTRKYEDGNAKNHEDENAKTLKYDDENTKVRCRRCENTMTKNR